MTEAIEVIAVGFLAGTVSGLFGVGGGTIFVPSLVFILGLTQIEANATSLLAIVPVAALGAHRQRRYGNIAVRDGVWIGVAALPATIIAAFVANELPDRVLQLMFAALALYVSVVMAQRALRPAPKPDAEPDAEPQTEPEVTQETP